MFIRRVFIPNVFIRSAFIRNSFIRSVFDQKPSHPARQGAAQGQGRRQQKHKQQQKLGTASKAKQQQQQAEALCSKQNFPTNRRSLRKQESSKQQAEIQEHKGSSPQKATGDPLGLGELFLKLQK